MSDQPNCVYCYDDGRPCSACDPTDEESNGEPTVREWSVPAGPSEDGSDAAKEER